MMMMIQSMILTTKQCKMSDAKIHMRPAQQARSYNDPDYYQNAFKKQSEPLEENRAIQC